MHSQIETNYAGTLSYAEPMKKYNSWRAGGVAEKLFKPANRQDLQSYLYDHQNEPITFLGLGSNVLVRDGGIQGSVIVLTGILDKVEIDQTQVYAEAGLPCSKLAKKLAKAGLAGGEFFAGIPGTVGGALAMNAGAWGGETWPRVESVEVISRDGSITQVAVEQVSYGYRHVEGFNNQWFLSANFNFDKGDAQFIEQRIKSLLNERAQKQPTGVYSCGSVFRNPENDHAARLIESCGLKGYSIGGACVAEKHANFIINDNEATAKDIEDLITLVQKTVLEKTGVQLIREVKILGSAL